MTMIIPHEPKPDVVDIPASILRLYDVRGTYDHDLTAAVGYSLGRRFGALIYKEYGRTVVVGYDGRLSSPPLHQALVRGLLDAGCDVTSIGLCPTPMLSYAHVLLNTEAAIMITGSHNPAHHNGFKITLQRGPFFDAALKKLAVQEPHLPDAPGTYNEIEVLQEYISRICLDLPADLRPYKVVWDIGHGAAGVVVPTLIEQLPGQHIMLYPEVDGTFPAHHPDPTVPANMVDLQRAVIAHGADLGVAFDGDGDRLGVVDHEGRVHWADTFLGLLAEDVLRQSPNASVVVDVKTSDALSDTIRRLGGTAVMAPTGHSIIKKTLKDLDAPLAGEMSGHIFFADTYYGYDDALYAALRLLRALHRTDASLAAWTNALPKVYATPELRIPFQGNKAEILEAIHEVLKTDADNHTPHVITMDGLRVSYPNKGWWLLRASNTQDIFVARAEGLTPEDFMDVQERFRALLKPHGIVLTSD